MSLALDQALLTKFIDSEFGIDIVFENGDYAVWNDIGEAYEYKQGTYTPTVGRPYSEVLVAQNDISAATLAHSDATDGVLNVILRYPPNEGALPAKRKADDIAQVFKTGLALYYGGVKLTITGSNRGPGVPETSWYKIILTLPYRAFLTR